MINDRDTDTIPDRFF